MVSALSPSRGAPPPLRLCSHSVTARRLANALRFWFAAATQPPSNFLSASRDDRRNIADSVLHEWWPPGTYRKSASFRAREIERRGALDGRRMGLKLAPFVARVVAIRRKGNRR